MTPDEQYTTEAINDGWSAPPAHPKTSDSSPDDQANHLRQRVFAAVDAAAARGDEEALEEVMFLLSTGETAWNLAQMERPGDRQP